MSENTKIEWADSSWSPWRGCTKVSAGCANCYAETLSKRNPAVLGQWGKGKPRVLAKNWNKTFVLDERFPLPPNDEAGTIKMRRRRIFPSLCDWLDEEVPIEWLARFLGLIQATPNIDWLLLTKRPENWESRIERVMIWAAQNVDFQKLEPVRKLCDNWLCSNGRFSNYPHIQPPANVWIGTSVEDQANADRRIPALLKIPARIQFLSVEPMLGQVDLGLSPSVRCRHCDNYVGGHATGGHDICDCRINWVIVGGESGPGARPCNVEWIRDVVRQCAEARVSCFVKQVGSNPVRGGNDEPFERIVHRAKYDEDHHKTVPYHPKGGDPVEWPEDLRVRQMPEVKP